MSTHAHHETQFLPSALQASINSSQLVCPVFTGLVSSDLGTPPAGTYKTYPSINMSLCKACEEPLVLSLDPDEKADVPGTETIPDDLGLSCGCHFHWYACFP